MIILKIVSSFEKITNLDKFVEEEKNTGRNRVNYGHCYSTSTKPVWTSVVTVHSECSEHVYIRRQGNDKPISRIIHPAQRCVLAVPSVNSATIKTLVSFSGEKDIWNKKPVTLERKVRCKILVVSCVVSYCILPDSLI